MELTPKLLAAADMCSNGEKVNLDELAFLLRYAAEELGKRPHSGEQQNALLATWRKRLLARCDLLNRPESERATIRGADIQQLIELEEALDAELQQRFPVHSTPTIQPLSPSANDPQMQRFQSGAA